MSRDGVIGEFAPIQFNSIQFAQNHKNSCVNGLHTSICKLLVTAPVFPSSRPVYLCLNVSLSCLQVLDDLESPPGGQTWPVPQRV